VPEKRGKPSPVQLSHGLEDHDISDDIFVINKLSGKTSSTKATSSSHVSAGGSLPHSQVDSTHDASIEDGRLLYDKRWFSKDQTVVAESKEHGKINASIVAISSDEILLKKISDNSKLRISVLQLQAGQYTLRKRTT